MSNDLQTCVNSYKGYNRNDEEFVIKYEKHKAFHTGSNLSCRQHIHQHYEVYQKRCKEENIPEHHWAIPHTIWNKTEDEKKGVKRGKQGTLDKLMKKSEAPVVFTCENALHLVTQFVAVDDQVKYSPRK